MPLPTGKTSLMSQVVHLLVLALMLVALLVLLTKFNWVHCSQVPGNWCDIYCNTIMRSHSRIALLYGEEGVGNAEELRWTITNTRLNTFLEPFQIRYLTAGMLEGYDLVIVEEARTVSFSQAIALRDYLDGGGSMIWVGDSLTNLYADDVEMEKARSMDLQRVYDAEVANQNVSNPHYYENFLLNYSDTRGFNFLSDVLSATYESTNASRNAEMKIVQRSHMMMNGLKPEIDLGDVEYARVHVDPRYVSTLAVIRDGEKEYPLVFETRYSGKIVYFAYPLEAINSTTLLQNVLDYLVTC
ncbi:hypothetical protein AUJ15_02645 [Candidatus Micrarchaeota archaeon CG1_02_55_41]|nr:MAG: hypothetical protein AUJ15_02645 [Candidatus Micrarchaeota archaeon CG1_02_55_41]